MAATTVDRNTPARLISRQIVVPLETTADIPAGTIVCTNAAGNAVPGADTAAFKRVGRAAHRATYSAGDRYITVEEGVFEWANDGTIAQANVGAIATILDNQTVSLAATTTNDIGLGRIEEITSTGVFVASLGGLGLAA